MHLPQLTLYSIADPAVDLQAMGKQDMYDYSKHRDPALVKAVSGTQPTKFICRDIPTSLFQSYVQNGLSEGEQYRRAFQCGVIAIEHLVQRTDGERRPRIEPSGRMRGPTADVPTWKDEELELIAPVYQQEIGSVLFTRSALPFGSEPTYLLPQLCLSVCLTRFQFSAAETQE